MAPRQRKGETLDTFFDRVLDAFRAEDVPQEYARKLASLRAALLNPGVPTMAAKEFRIEQAVFAFGLKFIEELHRVPGEAGTLRWRIQDIPETKDFVLTPCMHSLMTNYSKNFERSSEAVCRTALDFMLNECLTVLKGNHLNSKDQATDNRAQCTPTSWDNIKIFGEVSFSHKITRPANGKSVGDFLGTIVNGRVDHGIGRVFPPGRRDTTSQPKRRFQSLLLIVEAKTALNLDRALPQLVVYLASLHQSRLQRKRSDAAVYGVVSDGYSFIFVTISHDGELKRSRRFEVLEGDMLTVLGCLKYILETSANMSPNPTPEKDGGGCEPVEDHSDCESDMDVDDNDYVTSQE